jgi:hypothetical protein
MRVYSNARFALPVHSQGVVIFWPCSGRALQYQIFAYGVAL